MSTHLTELLVSVLPVLLLFGLGMGLRRTSLLDDPTIAGLKRLVVSVALPALLFRTFLTTRFQPEYLVLIATVFAACLLLLGVGFAFRRITQASEYAPFLFTGFELGMIGFALFTAVYGADQVSALGVIALGHEVFIWFIFVTLLRVVSHGRTTVTGTVRSLVASPVILAIIAGLTLNAFGLAGWMAASPAPAAVLNSLGYLTQMIVPLVLIIVGHGTRLSWRGVREALPLVSARLVIVVGLALVLNALVVRGLLGLPPIFEAALFTLLILPPPFIVPLFIPPERRADSGYAHHVLSLYTIASIAAFVGYVLVS